MILQSVIFDKRYWDSIEASSWLRSHKLKPIKRVHKTHNYLRYRINEPMEFNRFITRNLGHGIKFIFGIY
jgi:hypothetical protein